MKRIVTSPPCRALLAALMMASWLVLSNHCALGLMTASSTAAEHAGCCGQSSPGQDGQPSAPPVRECCQSMQAIPPTVALAILPAQIDGVPAAWLGSTAMTLTEAAHDAIICVLETGPPDARSFAELVLRHGVRAHAPPSFARS